MGFAAFSLIDVTRNLRTFFAIFDMFLGIFGSLALAVASLGIINTLVMAILERRREIGVLKALGAADRDVRRLFFAEAGVMGLAGGLFGVRVGLGDRPRDSIRDHHLFEEAGSESSKYLDRAVVAGGWARLFLRWWSVWRREFILHRERRSWIRWRRCGMSRM